MLYPYIPNLTIMGPCNLVKYLDGLRARTARGVLLVEQIIILLRLWHFLFPWSASREYPANIGRYLINCFLVGNTKKIRKTVPKSAKCFYLRRDDDRLKILYLMG